MLSPVSSSSTDPQLTVWVRAYGEKVKPKITEFVLKVLANLPSNLKTQLLLCTNENDPILEEVEKVAKIRDNVKVVYSKMSSYSSALKKLAEKTASTSNVLSLSVGVSISKEQIESAWKDLTGHVKVYGWMVTGHGNDGSKPGKGWYNTAALIDQSIIQQMKSDKEGVPEWVDNGFLGKLKSGDEEVLIGGNEEIPIMVEALRKDPESRFILNTRDPVTSEEKTGTGISFENKIKRKTETANRYLIKMHEDHGIQEKLEDWKNSVWKRLEII